MTLLGGDNNNLVEDSPEDLGPISTKHLLVWAYQIAKGMEYLGSMKVSALCYIFNLTPLVNFSMVDSAWRPGPEKRSVE